MVTPAHNKGHHIHRSISSVLAQTFEDYELILINDASTDNSLEEMQKFSDALNGTCIVINQVSEHLRQNILEFNMLKLSDSI